MPCTSPSSSGWLRVEPVPFTLSFTFYFVALQIAEALYFRTLLVNAGARASAGH